MSRQSLNSSSRFTNSSKTNSTDKKLSEIVNVYDHPDLTAIVEVIKNKFYFATFSSHNKKEPKAVSNFYLFDIDEELVYNNYYNDFGPLNIACLSKYCQGVNQLLKSPENKLIKIIHYTSLDPEKRTNAAYLVTSYMVLYLNKEPEEAYKLITAVQAPNLKSFQDASMGRPQYTIEIIDCLNGLRKASRLGFFNLDDFDVKEYEKYEKLKHGDLNWIVPRKFLAFIGPSTEPGSVSHYPEKYLNYFMKNEVTTVIRLNRRAYEPFRFTNAGILHYDLIFPDGTIPSQKILKQFLHIAETTRGAIAVHCKAGLGRTGTLIAAYIMKHYKMTARETIAYLRICRPGSVIGHQQTWLEEMQDTLWYEGHRYRLKYHGHENLILHHRRGIYSVAAKFDRTSRLKEYLRRDQSLSKTNSEEFKSNKKDPQELNQRCTSARELTKIKIPNLPVFKGKNHATQGDKLIEIKLRRS